MMLMKKKLKIKALDVILWFYITGFIALCVSMPWIRQRLPQRTPSPTPTAAPSTIPTSTPVPTVMAENTPVPSPLPTSTPVPQVEFDKTILADAVFPKTDGIAQSFVDESGKFNAEAVICSALTEEEKLIKPDYLLEAPQANELVTKTQKMNALAILLMERPIRITYGMPTEEIDEVIARFAAETNVIVFDEEENLTPAEKTKRAYEMLKERGDVAVFWQFFLAIQTEVDYLISKNIDVFFRNLTEDRYASLINQFNRVMNAVITIAEYDPEVKQAWDTFNVGEEIASDIDLSQKAIAPSKDFFSERGNLLAARRANLLK